MTNNRSNRNGGGRRSSQANQGTTSATPKVTEVAESVEDLKGAMFTFDGKMLDNYMTSKEKFLNYTGSKFGPSEQLSLEGGSTVVHNSTEPREIQSKSDYECLTYTEQKMWDLQLKSWNNKKEKVLENICRLYPYLWNQCTLPLKSKVKSNPRYTDADKYKDTVVLWNIIEEICSSTSSINSAAQRAMKARQSLMSLHGQDLELAKYLEMFTARAKVALEAGVDFGSESLVNTDYAEKREKDPKLTPRPPWRDPDIKIEMGLTDEEYLKIINWDDHCRRWYEDYAFYVHEEQLAHMFLEKAGIKYQEFRNGLENDWNKKNDNYPKTVSEAYTLLETYKGREKFISHIVQKNKRTDRSDTNSNSKTNSGLSFN